MNPFTALWERWREEAVKIRSDYGAEQAAATLEACARQLETAEREFFFETLTLSEAAEEAGVCYDTMHRKVRCGEIPNAGELNKPRVLRRDIVVGIDPPGPRPVTDDGEPDLAAEVLRGRS